MGHLESLTDRYLLSELPVPTVLSTQFSKYLLYMHPVWYYGKGVRDKTPCLSTSGQCGGNGLCP